MRRSKKFWLALVPLAALHALLLFAGFFASYGVVAQNRELPFAPPTRLHFLDTQGRFHFRPFIYPWVPRPGSYDSYQEDRSQAIPIYFLVRGAPYRLAGLLTCYHHLFGVAEPARMFLLGTDAYGRDQFSRLVYGARISLFAGLLAAGLSLVLGAMLGTLAGFYGKWLDSLLMRGVELFLALPWLYLLFAVRAFLPLDIGPTEAFLLVVIVIGLVGWARPARLVRGVVLSARGRNYILAARGFGASDWYLLRRHVSPQTFGVLSTQAALLIPQYVLAEVVLSFLGLGVGEPVPSLGNMLASLQQYHVLVSCWWMFFPGLALVPVFLAYHTLADSLHERLTPVAL